MAFSKSKRNSDSSTNAQIGDGTQATTDEGKARALETTLAGLNKRFGDGIVMKLGDASKLNVEVIPTGSLSLDIGGRVGVSLGF